MGNFTDAVRQGKIKAPQQNGFILSDWEDRFAATIPDQEDIDLHESGKWYAREFDSLRTITNEAFQQFRWAAQRERLLCTVGYAVREWTELHNQLRNYMERSRSTGLFTTELDSIPLQGPFLKQGDPVGLIESLVDGLRFPLSLSYKKVLTDKQLGAGTVRDLLWLTRLVLAGQHYHATEQCWLDCIWNGYRVAKTDSMILIEPRESSQSKHKAITEFRRHNIAMEATQRAASWWRHISLGEAGQQYLARRIVFRVYKRSGVFRVKVGALNPLADELIAFPILRTMILPEFAEPLLNRRSEHSGGLSLGQLMDAYELVSQIPDALGRFLPSHTGIERPEELLNWAPIFWKADLMAAFEGALGVDSIRSEWLVNQMTHTLNAREQLWFKPFVPISEQELALVAPAVSGVNYRRLFDALLQNRPDLDGELGALYEAHVYFELKNAMATSRLRRVSSICERPSFCFTVGPQTEEIDLAFVLGHHVFVCELKAGQFSSEPLEHLHYRKKLDEAAEQAKRKSQFVRENLQIFVEETNITIRGAIPQVHPLIVSSSEVFVGREWNGVPIVDEYILMSYFSTGRLDLLGYQDEGGTITPTTALAFYSSPAEAIRNLCNYLSNPPQTGIFESAVIHEDYPLPVFNAGESPKSFRQFVVRLPHAEMREQMNERKN